MVRDDSIRAARAILARSEGHRATDDARIASSRALARHLLTAARGDERTVDRARRWSLGRLSLDDAGQGFVTALADRAHRSSSRGYATLLVRALVAGLGTPRFMPPLARASLELAGIGVVPVRVVRDALRLGLRLGSAGLVHDATSEASARLVAARSREATSVNLNLVGEVVLGESDARARAEAYETLVRETPAAAISIKLSSIASQIALSDREWTIEALRPRLRRIYEAARTRTPHVLVNLDMEAFDDLEFTFELHRRLSEEPGLDALTTGVVLQAYLPDAHGRYEALLALAERRVARGGAPLRVRIVKGANLSMERHAAALRGHAMPTYGSKADTDASWLALVERALRLKNTRALSVGVASHNLFDLAFAMVVRAEERSEDAVQLEMLEGMADPLRRVLAEVAGSMLVYAPIVRAADFDAAVAYLVRRLEEATAPGHFLRSSFEMQVGDASYLEEEARFVASAEARPFVDLRSRRDVPRALVRTSIETPFLNEPDTDWSVARTQAPFFEALRALESATLEPVASIVSGVETGARPTRVGRDPSRPGVEAYAIVDADASVVDAALTAALGSSIGRMSARERAAILLDAAYALRRARPELVALMVLDAGKRIVEGDAEVSEAIDFAEYYARSALELAADRLVRASAIGPVVVASPWNFPLAIGAGGVFGALAAGNPVLLKPSPKAPLVAREFVRIVHEAGVPTDALALLVIDDCVARDLVADARAAAVVLTGGTATARAIRSARPSLRLFAETGGKNAMIVTASADRDLAIRDAVSSAFGHAGQKCSATSLLVCEREVYEDRAFRERLADAASSLPVGSAWRAHHVVTPLIEAPHGALARGLARLEPGESWLIAPWIDPDNPALVSPSIKLGTLPGSFTHQTELFGPVLAVMCADSLDDAIRVANGTRYGLTGAIHALDAETQERWLASIEVGNAYVNRGTTGAIVRRQPFGGTKLSCFGPGAKAGGPSYVRQLALLRDADTDTSRGTPNEEVRRIVRVGASTLDATEADELARIAGADAAMYARVFVRTEDPSAIATQRNLFARVPRRAHSLFVTPSATCFDFFRELVALATVAAPVIGVLGARVPSWVSSVTDAIALFPAEGAVLRGRLAHSGIRSVRIVGEAEMDFYRVAAELDLRVLDAASLKSSRDTLALHMEERSFTIEDHRYGKPLAAALRARWPLPSRAPTA